MGIAHGTFNNQNDFSEYAFVNLENEWRLFEYLSIDEMSIVGLNLLAKLKQIICSGKYMDPQVAFGNVSVIFCDHYL
jgi:hypothetical protein